jgi:hypothetical protein
LIKADLPQFGRVEPRSEAKRTTAVFMRVGVILREGEVSNPAVVGWK